MPKPIRALLWLAAGAFFVWQNAALWLWLRQHDALADGMRHMWEALTADWMLLLILSDACIFSALAIAWFYSDMRKRGFSAARRNGLLLAVLAIGSPVLLIYLALKEP